MGTSEQEGVRPRFFITGPVERPLATSWPTVSREGKGPYATDQVWRGVWLSGRPLNVDDGAKGDTPEVLSAFLICPPCHACHSSLWNAISQNRNS